MGIEGLAELVKFVQQGGTLITEGSTSTIFPEYGITSGVTVEEPAQLFVRGSILRARIADPKSPIAYGYARGGAGLLQSGAGAECRRQSRRCAGGVGQWRLWTEHHAECEPLRITPFEPEQTVDGDQSASRGRHVCGRASPRGGPGSRGAADRRCGCRATARRGAVRGEPESVAAVGHAGRRSVAGRAGGGRGRADRQRPRRDVCDPSVLAMADAGHVRARASTRS